MSQISFHFICLNISSPFDFPVLHCGTIEACEVGLAVCDGVEGPGHEEEDTYHDCSVEHNEAVEEHCGPFRVLGVLSAFLAAFHPFLVEHEAEVDEDGESDDDGPEDFELFGEDEDGGECDDGHDSDDELVDSVEYGPALVVFLSAL